MQAAFDAAEIAALREDHDATLTMRCTVRRRTIAADPYTGTDTTVEHLPDIACTFLRLSPGFRRNTPDREQITAEPTLYASWDVDVRMHDEIGDIREETGEVVVAGYMPVRTVARGQFSTTVVLLEVGT